MNKIEKQAHHDWIVDTIASRVPPAEWGTRERNYSYSGIQTHQYVAFYINLDECVARRRSIERELSMLGVESIRVEAIKEEYGSLGCLKSHIKALRIATRLSTPWVAIFEDDFKFREGQAETRSRIEFLFDNQHLAPVWMGTVEVNGPRPEKHKQYPDLWVANGACNTSSCYFIRNDYIEVLLTTWERSLAGLLTDLPKYRKLKREGKADSVRAKVWGYDCDSSWTPLQRRDKWMVFNPSLGYQDRGEHGSSINTTFQRLEDVGFR